MKKVYLLVSGVLLTAGAVNAQMNKEVIKYDFTEEAGVTNVRPAMHSERAADDIIWEDNFDDPGLWIAEGPSADYDINGWSIGTATNSWWGGMEADMLTAGNFARFANGDAGDDDPAVIADGPFTLTYSETFDLSAVPAAHLEFEQYGARFITLQAIEVSTDGGTSWNQVGNNDDIDPLTNAGGAAFGRPETRRYNLTAGIAADPSNVMLRFYWDGALNGADLNYIDYGWYIDNVRIVEGHAFDSEITTSYFRSNVGISFEKGLEYYQIPLDQATEIVFAAEMINQGANTLENLMLNAEVEFGGGSVYTGTSAPTDVLPTLGDSVTTTDGYTPDALGTYDVSWIFVADGEDTYTDNDMLTDEFEVTEYIYGRDNGTANGSISNVTSNIGAPLLIGNVMDIFADGVIGRVELDITADAENVGKLIFAQVMIFDDGAGAYIYADQTADHEITSGENGGTINLTFEDPITVFEGQTVLVLAGHYGGADEASFRTAQTVDEQTVLGYTSGATDPFFLTAPGAIMIRLDMRDFTSIEETAANNFAISQNMPNPFGDNSVINYELSQAAAVSVEFVDISGKIVKSINNGTQDAGTYTLAVDANDFAEGVYFYTFTVGAEKVTKRMVITK